MDKSLKEEIKKLQKENESLKNKNNKITKLLKKQNQNKKGTSQKWST